MPSPRAAYGRDYTAVAVQYDATQRTREQATAYQKARRQKTRADAIPGTPKHGASGTWPVQIRNGMPAPKLRTVTDTLKCGCVRRFIPANLGWELVTSCGRRRHA